MDRARLVPVGIALVCGLAGCQTSKPGTPHTVAAATPAQKGVLLDQVKTLAGTWELKGEDGKYGPGVVYAVSSAGSSVREIMFPGSPHEMTNVYHMDGPALVMTHYCAEGNQPRLRCSSAKPGEIPLTLDSISNMTASDQQYMGGLTLTMPDANTLVEHWTSFKEGKVIGDVTFTFRRKG